MVSLPYPVVFSFVNSFSRGQLQTTACLYYTYGYNHSINWAGDIMDFLNRNTGQNGQSGQPGRATQAPHGPSVSEMTNHAQGSVSSQAQHNHDNHDHEKHGGYWHRMPGWLRLANVVLLFSVTILALAIAFLLRSSNPNEGQYVMKDKYQAVFLNNGQVYFGKVTSSTSRYYNLQNVFYLSSNSTSTDANASSTASNNFTLVKLGCELHGPYDQMVINRDQVTFWENLKDSSTVVKTIKEWVKQNPNGQQCTTNTGSSNQSSNTGSTTQNATGSSTTTGTTGATGTTGSSSTGNTGTSTSPTTGR